MLVWELLIIVLAANVINKFEFIPMNGFFFSIFIGFLTQKGDFQSS